MLCKYFFSQSIIYIFIFLMVSFEEQKFLILTKFNLSTSFLLCIMLQDREVFFPFLIFTFGSMINCKYFFVLFLKWNKGLNSSFNTWKYNCTDIICCKTMLWHLCQKPIDYKYKGWLLDFQFFLMTYMSNFIPMLHCLDHHSFILCFEIKAVCHPTLFFFKVTLLFCFLCITLSTVKSAYIFLHKSPLHFYRDCVHV